MTEFGLSDRRAMAYWGVIEQATRDRLGTAEIWQAIREQAAASGLDSPGVTAQDVSRLRGLAGNVRATSARLENADTGYALDSTMIARAPWARPLAERNTLPLYQVRFEHTTENNGETTTEWRTVMFRNTLPTTVGELIDALQQDAEQMADDYGYTHVGIGSFSILAA